MADINQYNEVFERKVSLLSMERFPQKLKSPPAPPPEDKYYFITIFFLFVGVAGMVPLTFFLTATDYWMFKFRDISQENYDPNNKTFLQTNFASITSMLTSVPTALTTVIVSVFAHKIDLRLRLLGIMIALSISFISFTILVEVNTDSWQLGFFILTILVTVVNTFFAITFSISNYTLMTRFPPEYIKIHTYGSSMSGVISALLQICCLVIGGSSLQVALIYYLCGTAILVVAAILIYLTKYSPLYHYYMEGIEEETNKPTPSFADLKEVFKRVWLVLLPMVLTIPVMGLSSTTITILVVSESTGAWGKKFFTPVSTFLLKEISSLLGRVFATPIMTRKNAKWFILLNLLQAYGFGILIPLCNAKPKSHLPVLFPHDWQYMSLMTLNGLIMGYCMTVTFLSMSNFAGDKTEQAFQLFQGTMMIMMSVTSPLNQIWVNIL
ncbi:equilibrative nucleoside transporter 3 isoform X1 [Leptinotarsa decemlineata]|uniref:equilibrative nucleoside transporter 3 isoform X1 n=1 Tax=Leptinotarsa decemlineata TaxID=7539 RepID=UPI003D30610B